MTTCATCKHWERPSPPVVWGKCTRICDLWDWDGFNNPILEKCTSAWLEVVVEHEPYAVEMRTLAAFGCLMHEPKDES